MPLSRHLFLLVLFTLTLPVALLLVKESDLRGRREQELKETAMRHMQVAEARLDAVIGSTQQMLETLAEMRVAQLPADTCSDTLGRLREKRAQFAYFAVADPGGSIFCASDAALLGAQTQDHALLSDALARGGFVTGTYRAAAAGTDAVLPFAAPMVRTGGEAQSVILAGMKLDWLPAYLANTEIAPWGSITVADRNGTVLAEIPRGGQTGGERLKEPYSAFLHGSEDSLGEATGADAKTKIVAYSPPGSPPLDLLVAVTFDKDSFFAPIERDTMRDGSVIVLTVLLAVSAAWGLAARRIGGPIRRLAATATKWQEGDYTARAGLERRVLEIGALGQGFDDLAGKLAVRERELRDVTAAKARLLAVAGHDLRQPLQVLALVIDRFGRLGTNAVERRDVAGAEKALTRLNTALDTLVEVARLDVGDAAVHRRSILLGDVLREIWNEWLPAAEEKRLRLRLVASSAIIVSDPGMLRTILRNLVGNAIKYTDRGGVLIGARRRGSNATIQIVDTGKGIAKDVLPRIFIAFEQIDPTREGFGLGLSIVQRTAEALGHALHVSSAQGRGTCFAIDVPLAGDTAAASPAARP
jgi:signal transduction histidine kinase